MGCLSVITRNRSIDRVRRRRRMVSLDSVPDSDVLCTLSADTESPDQYLTRFEEAALVFPVLASQSPLRRQLIELAFLRGIRALQDCTWRT
jgi:DNA-directed RNA polymerase specialized sigma24 family protein